MSITNDKTSIYKDVGFLHRMMIKFCDGLVRMRIVRIDAAK